MPGLKSGLKNKFGGAQEGVNARLSCKDPYRHSFRYRDLRDIDEYRRIVVPPLKAARRDRHQPFVGVEVERHVEVLLAPPEKYATLALSEGRKSVVRGGERRGGWSQSIRADHAFLDLVAKSSTSPDLILTLALACAGRSDKDRLAASAHLKEGGHRGQAQ